MLKLGRRFWWPLFVMMARRSTTNEHLEISIVSQRFRSSCCEQTIALLNILKIEHDLILEIVFRRRKLLGVADSPRGTESFDMKR